MTRQKPPLIDAMENASFSFRCKNGHEFSKTGAWLRRNPIFGCSKCVSGGRAFVYTDEMVQQLFNERINRLQRLLDQESIGATPRRSRRNIRVLPRE
jgi:hypothetical protein